MRSQERRRRRSGFWTICRDSRRRSGQDIPPIGASLLRRSPKDIETICGDGARRSAIDIQWFGAGIVRRLSQNIAMSGDSPQRSPEATSRLLSNPWRPNTQARPRNIPPKRNDCYTYTRTVASASRESITMVARYHHLAIRIAQFGHDLTLTSRREIRAVGVCERRSKPEKPWNANLGTQILG